MNLDRTTQFFASLHIPYPRANLILASGTECTGGLLLLIGLASRLITLPLFCVLVVAYITADSEAVKGIFHDPDKFVTATPFLFMLAVIIVFVFRSGKFSADWLIARAGRKSQVVPLKEHIPEI